MFDSGPPRSPSPRADASNRAEFAATDETATHGTAGAGIVVPADTIAGRRARLVAATASFGVDGLLSESPADIRYFTDCQDATGYLLLTTSGEAHLLTSAHDGPQARGEAVDAAVSAWQPGEEPLRALLALAARSVRRFLTPGLSAAAADILRRDGVEIVVEPGVTWAIRRVKEPGELALIREAARIAEAGMSAARLALRPGVTEIEVAATAEQVMRTLGSDGRVFESKVESGPRSAWPSTYASGRRIAWGDLVLIDLGPTLRGYYGDLTRTFIIGEPSPEQQDLLELTLAAQAAVLGAMRPGASGHEVDAAARSLFEAAGHGDAFLHHTGHTLGLAGDSVPLLAPNVRESLLAGEGVTVEPGVYIQGLGGVRIEDEVLVTADGAELLTSFGKRLNDLIVGA